jgi:hypothetical protein
MAERIELALRPKPGIAPLDDKTAARIAHVAHADTIDISCNLTLVVARLAARPLVCQGDARASSAPAPAVSAATATATGPAG